MMANPQQQQQQQQNFKPEKILMIELGDSGSGAVTYKKMREIVYISHNDFQKIIEKILNADEIPYGADVRESPYNAGDRAKEPLLCNGKNTEVVFYIKKQVGCFPDSSVPFYDLTDGHITHNLRTYHMIASELCEVASSETGSTASSQLAVFSYRGREARSRPEQKPYKFAINVKSGVPLREVSLRYPGAGDIGHPGGSHP